MSSSERQPRLEFHPAHWAIITDQLRRMMDVGSVLDCARYVLHNDDEIDVEGAVSIAYDILDDIIGKFDSVSLRASAESWLADRDNPERKA